MAQTPVLNATYRSDNIINISWGRETTVQVQVSIDGEQWTTIRNHWGSEYDWSGATADHGYVFRGRSFEGTPVEYSDWSEETGIVYTTPLPPSDMSIRPIYTTSQSAVNFSVHLDNDSPIASSVEYQWSATSGGRDWFMDPITASDTADFSIHVPASMWLRVRNVAPDGKVSAWLTSDWGLVSARQPQKPTFVSNIGVFDLANRYVTIEWLYNNADNSLQGSCELGYSFDGGSTWIDMPSGTTEQKRTLDVVGAMGNAGVSTPCEMTVRVRTYSSSGYPTPSEWGSYTFSVYSAPSFDILTPRGSIEDMPLYVEVANYEDMAGFTANAATVTLMKNGSTVYSENGDVGSQRIASIDTDEFTPENGEDYILSVTIRSSSGLQSTETSDIHIDFQEPVAGTLEIENHPDTGYVTLTASYESTRADAPAVAVSVKRVNLDGTETLILDRASSGTAFTDRYAPLNSDYRYAVITHAENGAIKTVYYDNRLSTSLWFAYWGDNIAKAKWNPANGGIHLSRPEKVRIHYSGRKDEKGRNYPVSYDGSAVSWDESPSWSLIEGDEVRPFIQLMEDGGRGVYKSCDGWVFHADFDVTANPAYTAIGYYGGVAVSITRIAGDKL